MKEKKYHDCGHCGATVKVAWMEMHNKWHAKVDPNLEEPTTPYGFWGPKGRWNPNSRLW